MKGETSSHTWTSPVPSFSSMVCLLSKRERGLSLLPWVEETNCSNSIYLFIKCVIRPVFWRAKTSEVQEVHFFASSTILTQWDSPARTGFKWFPNQYNLHSPPAFLLDLLLKPLMSCMCWKHFIIDDFNLNYSAFYSSRLQSATFYLTWNPIFVVSRCIH